MEFRIETTYNSEALTTMARALRKTARRKRSRRTRIWSVLVIALALLLMLPLDGEKFVLDGRTIVTGLAVAAILVVLVFEDKLNGYIAKRRMLPGLESAVVTFREDGYTSETEVGTSEFAYKNITSIAETENYFVFIFSQNHAQIYDKRRLTGGSADAFCKFVEEITEKTVQKI